MPFCTRYRENVLFKLIFLFQTKDKYNGCKVALNPQQLLIYSFNPKHNRWLHRSCQMVSYSLCRSVCMITSSAYWQRACILSCMENDLVKIYSMHSKHNLYILNESSNEQKREPQRIMWRIFDLATQKFSHL